MKIGSKSIENLLVTSIIHDFPMLKIFKQLPKKQKKNTFLFHFEKIPKQNLLIW